MKKSMILFISLMLLLIKANDEYDDFINGDDSYYSSDESSYGIDIMFKGVCEDEKAKTGACMYTIYDDDHKYMKYSIFKKCGKGELCDEDFNMCVTDFNTKFRKVGKSCNYDDDCISKSCVSHKCTVAKEGDKCSEIDCENGLYCPRGRIDTPKCVKLAKEGEKAENTECMGGLGIGKDGKCVKYGTIEDKADIGYGDQLICKSGYAHQKTGETYYICDSIDTEPECGDNNSLKKAGKWGDGTEIRGGCTTKIDHSGGKINYNQKYSKLKSTLYADFIKDFNKLDIDKINSDKYTSWKDGIKSKTIEKWYLYQYANHLKAAGIIDSDGKVIKDKKCLYEFVLKNHLHSGFIKINTIIIAIISLLLF